MHSEPLEMIYIRVANFGCEMVSQGSSAYRELCCAGPRLIKYAMLLFLQTKRQNNCKIEQLCPRSQYILVEKSSIWYTNNTEDRFGKTCLAILL